MAKEDEPLRLHVQAELGLLSQVLMECTTMGIENVEAVVDDFSELLKRKQTHGARNC